MKLRYFSFFIMLLFTIGNCKMSYAQKKDPSNKFGFYFKGKYQKTAKVPFDLYANLIVIKVKIDKGDTLNFILDTGVSSFILTDPTLSEKIKLNYTRSVKIKGAGKEEYVTGKVSVGHSLSFGFVQIDNTSLVALDNDILQLSEYMGIPIHGIFGYELFQRFVVNIDFSSKNIYLTEPDFYKEKKRFGTKYPMVVTQTKPYIEATSISQKSENIQALRLVIDTGAGHALMLNTQDNSAISLPDKVIRANLGKGLNGDIVGHIGRIEKFKIGKYEFNDILASFPDSLSFGSKFDADSGAIRQGSIGGELLRRFMITFNYKEGYLILKPLKAKAKETFEHDMSGMEVRAKGKDLDEFFVTYVSPDSQADKAGVQVDDQIIFLNSKNFKSLTINDIYSYLSKKQGYGIELFLRRNGEIKYAYFKLKRVI
jgi:predicted aspartyl protease